VNNSTVLRGLIVCAFINCVSIVAFGQIQNPVTWTFESKKKAPDSYELTLTANLPGSWHIYSQNTGKGGPVPTSVTFKPNALIVMNGKPREVGKLEKAYDQNFKTNVLYYSNRLQLIQTLRMKGATRANIMGAVEYMVCDDHQCLPPTKKSFNVALQ